MGAVVRSKAVWSRVLWALPVLVGLVIPLWENGPPTEATASLVIAGLLLRAREVHAEKPGVWFPLLVTGSTSFAFAVAGGLANGTFLVVGSAAFQTWRFLIGLAVVIGLGFWAWRARSFTVAVTALGYLTTVWYLLPVPFEEGMQWVSRDEFGMLKTAYDTQLHPELVIVAGAVLAYARLDRVRPWHVVAIAGLLGSLWHYGALTLLLVAAVLAAYDLNARRPGAWYPLLMAGVGLVAWSILDEWTTPQWPEPVLEGLPYGYYTTLTAYQMNSTAVAHSFVDYDELFAALVVAVGLGVWSWRRRSPIMMLTAAVYLAAAWFVAMPAESPEGMYSLLPDWREWGTPSLLDARPVELVVLAGAAVAFATAAPGTTRTAGRSAGTPDRPPGP
ncbi:hypothetical protein [Saccharothrix deserti]|uniref:hypothetical protein n=1 Tax=Saccharothrix deserti TaxID=2593674 RepID=UPI00131E6D49|nr:hypothetical protein [Saccharothrix deserti]